MMCHLVMSVLKPKLTFVYLILFRSCDENQAQLAAVKPPIDTSIVDDCKVLISQLRDCVDGTEDAVAVLPTPGVPVTKILGLFLPVSSLSLILINRSNAIACRSIGKVGVKVKILWRRGGENKRYPFSMTARHELSRKHLVNILSR